MKRHDVARRVKEAAFRQVIKFGQVFRTENGDAEQYLPETAPERAMIHGAAEELVEQLRTKTSYRYHTNSVLLMRGNETVKVRRYLLLGGAGVGNSISQC